VSTALRAWRLFKISVCIFERSLKSTRKGFESSFLQLWLTRRGKILNLAAHWLTSGVQFAIRA
jgi:hypothetical protein